MAVDRGRLDYGIRVRDEFADTLARFRRDIEASRRAFGNFKNFLANSRTDAAALRQDLASVSKAARDIAAATQSTERASRSRTSQLAAEEAATRRNEAAKRRLLAAEQASNQAESSGLRTLQAKASQLSVTAKAQAELTRQQERAAIALEKIRLAEEQGIATGKRKIGQLSVEEEVTIRVANANRKLAINQALAVQGRGPTGAPLPLPQRPPTIQQQAQTQLNQQIRGLQVQQALTGLQATNQQFQQLTQQARAAAAATAGLNTQFGNLNAGAGRVGFSFQRLLSTFAVFTVVRRSVQGFFGLITDSINFNRQVEISQRSIAGLLSAVADVRDAFGNTVDKATQFKLVQGVAAEQIKILRSEAQKTAATFQDLLLAFQTAIGPGFAAGLKLDEIRKFAVSISQAASQLGVAQNQLAEEIRSLVTGTISPRATRIATALGITNEDIRLAKETGVLADFLRKKFEAFSISTQASIDDFDILFGNLRDSLQQVIGTGTIGFFEQLKGLIRDVKTQLQTTGEGGIITPNPNALRIITQIGKGLESAVKSAREFVASLSIDQLANAAKLVGDSLQTIASTVGFLFKTALSGVGDVAQVITGLATGLRQVADDAKSILPGLDLASILKILLEIRIATVAWLFLFRGAASLIRGIGAVFGSVLSVFKFLIPATATWAASLKTGAASLALGVVPILRIIAGLGIAATTAGFFARRMNLAADSAEKAATSAEKLAASTGKSLLTGITFFGEAVLVGFIDAVNLAKRSVEDLGKFTSTITEKDKQTLEDMRARHKVLDETGRQLAKSLRDTIDLFNGKEVIKPKRGIDQQIQEFAATLDKGLSDVERTGKIQEFANFLKNQLLRDTRTFVGAFESLPPIIAQATSGLDDESKTIEELLKDIRKARNELDFSTAFAAIDPAIRTQLKSINDAEFSAAEKLHKITLDAAAKEQQILDLKKRQTAVLADETGLTVEQADARKRILDLGKQFIESRNLELQAQQKVKNQTDLLSSIVKTGNEEAITAAQIRSSIASQEAIKQEEITKSIKDRLKDEETKLRVSVDAGTFNKILEQAKELLNIGQVQKTLELDLQKIAATRLNIRTKELEAAQKLSAAELRIFNTEQQRELDKQRVDVQGQVRSAQAALTHRASVIAVADVQNEIAKLKLDAQTRQEITQHTIDAVHAARDGTQDLDRRREINQELEGLLSKQNLDLIGTSAQLSILIDKEKRLKQEAEGSFGEGLFAGFSRLHEELPTAFQNGLDAARIIVQDFAAFASNLIVDAFDPTKKVDFGQRFAQLLSGIAQQLLQAFFTQQLAALFQSDAAAQQTLAATTTITAAGAMTAAGIQWAITAAAITAAATALAISAGISAVAGPVGLPGIAGAGRHEGGKAPTRQITRLPGHQHARGFNLGGTWLARPSSLHPSDNIPAWLGHDEWVINARQARRVGDQWMADFNAGNFDPEDLLALSATHRHRSASSPSVGLAAGGPAIRAAAARSGGSVIVALPAAPSERDQERRLAAGPAAMIRWMEENSSSARAALGVSRGAT